MKKQENMEFIEQSYSQIYIRNVASPKAYPNQEQSRIN